MVRFTAVSWPKTSETPSANSTRGQHVSLSSYDVSIVIRVAELYPPPLSCWAKNDLREVEVVRSRSIPTRGTSAFPLCQAIQKLTLEHATRNGYRDASTPPWRPLRDPHGSAQHDNFWDDRSV